MSLNLQRVMFVLVIVFFGAGCASGPFGVKRADLSAVNPKEAPRPHNFVLAAGANKYLEGNRVVIFVTVENRNVFPLHPSFTDPKTEIYFYAIKADGDSRPRILVPASAKVLNLKKEVAPGSGFLFARYEFTSAQFGSTGVFFLSAKTLDESFSSAPLRLEIASRRE